MIINKIHTPLDIIILAGQSNAEGYGLGETEHPYTEDQKIMALSSVTRPAYVKDDNGKDVFFCPESDHIISVVKESEGDGGKIGCLALPFAEKYRNKYLADGRELLIVKMGIGGTGFAHSQWGVGECLYERLVEMTDAALAMNGENRVTALLWHQGECDAFERPDLTAEEREETHRNNLYGVMTALRSRYGNMPIICGGFAEEWSSKFRIETEAVMSAVKNVCCEIKYAEFVAAADLRSNNQDTGNGDDIHFCRSSLYILAERYFSAYNRILNNKLEIGE